MKIIDLSYCIKEGIPVYPGDERVSLQHNKTYDEDFYNNFILTSGMHIGTHIDGPMHMTNSIHTMNDFDLSCFIGNGVLIDCRQQNEIDYKEAYQEIIKKDDMVLFYTGWDEFFQSDIYYKNYPVLTERLATFLIEKEVKLVGLDTPSVDQLPHAIHKLLLSKTIFIVENLRNLEELIDQSFEFYAIPLNIKADSSLVRAFARLK